jgi:hypothetical protein
MYNEFNAIGLEIVYFSAKCSQTQRAFFIILWARQLSVDVPADAGFLCVTAAGIWDTIKGTTVTDVPLELITEVMRQTNVISVINRLWHLTASSVCIATGKLLDWRVGVAYCGRLHPVRPCSWAQTTSYFVGTVGSLPGIKRPGSKFCLSLHLV